MKSKWIAALVMVAALIFSVSALQEVMAAERTMVIKTPGCV